MLKSGSMRVAVSKMMGERMIEDLGVCIQPLHPKCNHGGKDGLILFSSDFWSYFDNIVFSSSCLLEWKYLPGLIVNGSTQISLQFHDSLQQSIHESQRKLCLAGRINMVKFLEIDSIQFVLYDGHEPLFTFILIYLSCLVQ